MADKLNQSQALSPSESYSDGRATVTGHDQRSEYRLTGRASLILELEAEDPAGGEFGHRRTATGQTHDLSATGMQVLIGEALTPAAILPMDVVLAGDHTQYRLSVEVVWCEPRGAGQYAVGLTVLDSDETSFMEWIDAVARALVQD